VAYRSTNDEIGLDWRQCISLSSDDCCNRLFHLGIVIEKNENLKLLLLTHVLICDRVTRVLLVSSSYGAVRCRPVDWSLTRKVCYRKDDHAMHPIYDDSLM